MDLQKYKDLAYQNPRGKLIKAILDANIEEWNAVCNNYCESRRYKGGQIITGDQVATRAIWGFGVEQWPAYKLQSTPLLWLFDNWLEQKLTQQAVKYIRDQQ